MHGTQASDETNDPEIDWAAFVSPVMLLSVPPARFAVCEKLKPILSNHCSSHRPLSPHTHPPTDKDHAAGKRRQWIRRVAAHGDGGDGVGGCGGGARDERDQRLWDRGEVSTARHVL